MAHPFGVPARSLNADGHDGQVVDDAEIRRRLMSGSSSAFAGAVDGLAAADAWLSGLSAAELLRVDGLARQWRWQVPALGRSQQWTTKVMNTPALVVAALASMHPDGFVRERAVARLATAGDGLSDRALALRLTDHVPSIRDAAARAVLGRTRKDCAARIMPILELVRDRHRVGDVRSLYLHQLMEQYGEAEVWATMRQSPDRVLRRVAFRQSLAAGLLDVDGAVAALPMESDQVVRAILSRAIAEVAPPEVIADFLLKNGTAEGRALGLVRLTATQIDPAVLKRLLIDSSVLVRDWARTRWSEQGHDVLSAYRAMSRDGNLTPRSRSRAYAGLVEAGGTIDREEAHDLTHSGQPPLVKVGLRQLAETATPEDVAGLFDVVRTGTNKEARLASSALNRLHRFWQIGDLAAMKESADSDLRRRAWWLHRGLGGWEETLADLDILLDSDADLAKRGRIARPPMYEQPSDEQRQRLRSLLPYSELSMSRRLEIAVAAGIRDVVAEQGGDAAAVVGPVATNPSQTRTSRTTPSHWLRGWLRKR